MLYPQSQPAPEAAIAAAIRLGITDARKDFNRLYHFWSGSCQTESFTAFLAIGDFYTDPLSTKAWRQTIFKEIDRVEALFSVGAAVAL